MVFCIVRVGISTELFLLLNLSIDVCFVDIDECNTNNGGCKETCNNNDGSYECTCQLHYKLATDNHSCQGIV